MSTKEMPNHYQSLKQRFPKTLAAIENLGATADEIYHALLILVSTVGFPKVAAAISWADDVIHEK